MSVSSNRNEFSERKRMGSRDDQGTVFSASVDFSIWMAPILELAARLHRVAAK